MNSESLTKKIAFLCYLNRSGSTFLAKELDKIDGICVGIEGEFYDGYQKPFYPISNRDELREYIDKTYDDVYTKLNLWGIDKNDLIKNLDSKNYPILFKDFLTTVLKKYFKNKNTCKIIIHKAGTYHKYVDRIEKDFVDAKFIFINRDPRSVYNSQKKTLGSISKKPMVNDIETFINKYRENHRKLIKYKNKHNFYIVNYEELIINKEETIAKLCNFLGITALKKEDGLNYFEKIPTTQKRLHKKVKKEADKRRVSSWIDELDKKEIFMIQRYLSNYILLYDYQIHEFEFVENIKYFLSFLASRFIYFKDYEAKPILREIPLLQKIYSNIFKS